MWVSRDFPGIGYLEKVGVHDFQDSMVHAKVCRDSVQAGEGNREIVAFASAWQ
jgi:hypothetical protein